jgi:hypothetical protein
MGVACGKPGGIQPASAAPKHQFIPPAAFGGVLKS